MFLTWGQYAWNRYRFYSTNLFLQRLNVEHPKDDTWFKQWSDFGWFISGFTGVAYAWLRHRGCGGGAWRCGCGGGVATATATAPQAKPKWRG